MEETHELVRQPRRYTTLWSRREKGVYILVLGLCGERAIGRLGSYCFNGTYLYVGSAQGSGGFKRLIRHREVALGQRGGKRWHIDYLLPGAAGLQALWLKTDAPLECRLAQLLSQVAIPVLSGFGSSDCRCPTHLFQLRGEITRVMAALKGAGLAVEAVLLSD